SRGSSHISPSPAGSGRANGAASNSASSATAPRQAKRATPKQGAGKKLQINKIPLGPDKVLNRLLGFLLDSDIRYSSLPVLASGLLLLFGLVANLALFNEKSTADLASRR